GRDGAPQGIGVAEGDDLETGGEGTEALAVLLLGGEAHDGNGAAVEVVGDDDDLGFALADAFGLVTPFARELDGGLDGFGAGVHHQRHLEAGDLVEVAEEERKLVIAEGARGECHATGLLLERGQDLRVAMALVDGRVGGEEVEIAAAADVRDPRAGSALNDDVERMVVVGAVAVFKRDESVGIEGKHGGLYLRGYPSRRRPD